MDGVFRKSPANRGFAIGDALVPSEWYLPSQRAVSPAKAVVVRHDAIWRHARQGRIDSWCVNAEQVVWRKAQPFPRAISNRVAQQIREVIVHEIAGANPYVTRDFLDSKSGK